MSDAQRELVLKFAADRHLAHEVLFKHRHSDATPHFHEEMTDDWYKPNPYLCWISFRGSAKSTKAEEAIILQACYREFSNCILFGASARLAEQRLHAIRREFEKNQFLRQLFGDLRGQPWADDKLELSNGVVIQAMGRGQALRGTKEEIKRPDLLIFDDIEDRESVRTPEGREKTMQWVLGEAIPMMDTGGRVRMLANDMDPECLANQLKKPDSQFTVKVYPWEYVDEKGERRPTWPGRFPLPYIDSKKRQMVALGRLGDYNKEFMCKSESPEEKPFKPEMFRVEPQVRTWHATYCMVDPARTVNRTSATTGFAAWSWIGGRLIVWESWARMLMPDEIIDEMFSFNEVMNPTTMYFEEDGLNEWALQPIRQEQVKRGIMLPLKAVKAPKGKMDFIRGLQPYFNAREVLFAKDLPDLKAQFLSFPTGKIDAPNALAYAPRLRPGVPLYEDFGARHVIEDLRLLDGKPAWLAMNATQGMVTAMLVQFIDGAVRVYADWVREGEPSAVLPDVLKEATLEAGRTPKIAMGPLHWDQYTNVGLRQAATRLGLDVRKGIEPNTGRVEVRGLLAKEVRTMPAFLVSSQAKWTTNGFAGGYCRAMLKGGALAPFAEEGVYRTMMEGLESYCGLLKVGSPDEDGDDISYDYTAQGRRFISARR